MAWVTFMGSFLSFAMAMRMSKTCASKSGSCAVCWVSMSLTAPSNAKNWDRDEDMD
jgi:hypothetical protein